MFDKREEEAVLRVMRSGKLSGYQGNWSESFYGGDEVKALEKEWAEYFGVKHAIACNSATSGLWMALNAIGIDGVEDDGYGGHDKENDIIFVTPYSMTCSATIPLLFNADVRFVDIEPDYFCMDADNLEHQIIKHIEHNKRWGYKNNLRAIIVVDLFGQPYDADRINSIAKKYNLIVIEDASQAPGAKYKGKYAGTLGDIGVFSLNRHKHIQCGEGGICVTNDDDLAFKLRLSMNHAEAVVNDMERQNVEILDGCSYIVGMNLRMPELSAAIAREQLKKLDEILKIYQEDAKQFPIKIRPDCEHSFYRYAWDGKEHNGMHIKDKFNSKFGYITPLFQMPLFRQLGYEYDQTQCPVVQEVNKNIVLAWHKEPI